MTRSSVTPPQCGVADRYDVESFPSDDFVNWLGDGSEDADRAGEVRTTPDGAVSHPRASLLRAAKQLLDHLNDGNEDYLDVDGVAEFLHVPRTAAHCILDILEVFQAVEFTVDTMAKWLWEAQDSTETIPTIAEAHSQQLRALTALIADVLAVIEALGLIDYARCPKRQAVDRVSFLMLNPMHLNCMGAVYLFNPNSKSQLISPKGMQQSTRMRNMRVMFDGPAPTQDRRPGTSASHRSNPRSTGAPARPYTAATIAAGVTRGRARPMHTPMQPRTAVPAATSDRAFPAARTSSTPPPPKAHTRNAPVHGRQARGIYAARAPAPTLAPPPQLVPRTGRLGSEVSWRGGRLGATRPDVTPDEDVRSAVYPTTSEWCSMQQELVEAGASDGSTHEDVFSTGSPGLTPQLCEDVHRLGLAAGRGLRSLGPSGPRDVSCSGRVEGRSDQFSLSYAPSAAVRQNSSSGYYRSHGYPGSGGSRMAGKAGGVGPERRSSSVGPRGTPADVVRDVDQGTAGGVAKLKHMFETTRMSRIGTFAGSTRVHHMVQRYEGGDARPRTQLSCVAGSVE